MGKLKVCAVDNDKTILFLISLILKRLDKEAEFISFHDGAEAFAFLNENAGDIMALPHIILLDLNMDEMNGWAFLEAYENMMPKLARHIHIYIHSTSTAEKDISRAKAHKLVIDYLDKPIDEEQLGRILKAVKMLPDPPQLN